MAKKTNIKVKAKKDKKYSPANKKADNKQPEKSRFIFSWLAIIFLVVAFLFIFTEGNDLSYLNKKNIIIFAGVCAFLLYALNFIENQKQTKSAATDPNAENVVDQINQNFKQNRGTILELIKSIGIAFLAALVLRMLLIQAFRIPTGSMKDTLLVGDFLLVNKFIYGIRTPDRIPLTDIEIPYWRIPGPEKPKRGNIVVFKYPKDENLDYIKRCVGCPGETLQVKRGEVYVNGKIEGEIHQIRSRIVDKTEYNAPFDYHHVKTNWGDEYVIRQWSEMQGQMDSYGPVYIPKKGDVIQFPLRNEDEWLAYQNLIEHYERSRHSGQNFYRDARTNRVYINGQEVTSYTIPDDYYFMMGDNRDNSSDSRDWGFLPFRNVVGEALLIYFSWDSSVNILDENFKPSEWIGAQIKKLVPGLSSAGTMEVYTSLKFQAMNTSPTFYLAWRFLPKVLDKAFNIIYNFSIASIRYERIGSLIR